MTGILMKFSKRQTVGCAHSFFVFNLCYNLNIYLIQKIGWYRHLFTFISAINVACLAWLIGNFDKKIIQLLILNTFAIFFLVIANILVIYEIRKYLNKLRD